MAYLTGFGGAARVRPTVRARVLSVGRERGEFQWFLPLQLFLTGPNAIPTRKDFQLASHPQGRRTAKPVRTLPESQSKFDRWLEKQVEKVRVVTFVFHRHPISGVHTGSLQLDCTPIAVDRYMLLVEFPSGETWWTSKANILSAGLPTNG
jgi:hypothetical protein